MSELPGDGWFDPIEVAIRDRVRGFIETLVEAELDEALTPLTVPTTWDGR